MTGTEVHYLTARDAGRTALLAGPFTTGEAAARHADAGRRFLAERLWKDTLGAFVSVGVTSAEVRPGRTARRARFHSAVLGEATE